MTKRRAATHGRRSLALLLALVAVLLPTAGHVARAADDELRFAADATYRIDTDDGVIRVRLDVRVTNLKPNSVRRTATQVITTRYYYDRLLFNIQREARSVRATSNGSSLRVSLDTKTNHRLLTVRMPNLEFRQSRNIRIEYDLPGGKPRSSGDIRVGAAFATFTAWAWGDDGRSSVRIVMPTGFKDTGYGMTLTSADEDGRIVMSSGTIQDPSAWYYVIVADRPSALTDVRLGTAESPIVVQAWPEDTAWRDQVSQVLRDGVPVLQELVELEWPVAGDLTVTEVHTPLLEGYAGVYESMRDEIRISEDLDAQTILHEASHAWFDRAFVDERWITEGLAEEYAARARLKLGLDGPAGPEPTDREGKTAFPLDDWPQPGRTDDKETAAREDFGYAASWVVMRDIVAEAGEDGMRDVFHAIARRTIPYVGDGAPETAGRTTDWRAFLDLVQEVGGADGAEELVRTWVVPATALAELDARATARKTYHALEDEAGEWAPPYLVRERLWYWSFQEATAGMTAASEVLVDRDALAVVSGRLGAAAPDDVETRFEAAKSIEELDALEAELERRAEVAETLIATRDEVGFPRTPLADLGLAGEVPAAGLDAGLAAFTSGDLDGALGGASTTSALLAGAEEIGKGRAIAIAAAVVGLLLLMLVAAWWVRRRRGRAPTLSPSVGPDAPTTLAATPDPAAAGSARPPAANPPAPGVDPD